MRAGGASPSGRQRPARLGAEERRRQVVAAARGIVLKQGFAALTMRRLAARAGVSPAALYVYFPNRLSLLAAVADELFQGLLEAFRRARSAAATDPDPRARLHAMMTAYVEWGLAHPDEYRVIFMTPIEGVAGHRPGVAGVPAAPSGQATYALLEEEVARLIEAGHLRPAPPQLVAETIWAAGHGLVSLLITKPGFPWSPRPALMRMMAETLTRGLAP